MPNIRWLIALVSRIHRCLYRASGGWLGARLAGIDILLLGTVGRISGKRRLTPLLYVRDGDRWVVVASNGGDDRNPAWWLNLQSRPEAEIQVGAQRFAVRARPASAEEAEGLWPKLLASYRFYTDYRQRTAREIPVVILERAS